MEKHRLMAVASPRESAKSTILAFLKPIHSICLKKVHFVLITSNTYAKSCGSLATIKKELRDNPRLKRDYGIEIPKDAEGDSIFRHPCGHEIRVLCKGADQLGSVRGEKFGAHRPDLIIVDDLEDDEMVKNPDRRAYLKDLYDQALIPAGERGTCRVIAIGTILHDDALMAKLVAKDEYTEYGKLFYRARNEINGKRVSLWEEKWTVEWLDDLERRNPSVFAKEYQNDPVAGVMRKFHKEDFRYWAIEEDNYVLYDDNGRIQSKGELTMCKPAIACDLAWEIKRESDFSVIMPAYLTPKSEILVDTYFFKKGLRPHEMEEVLFTMEERLRSITGSSVPIGFEKAKLEKVMKHLMKQAMMRRNKYLMFRDLQWDMDKTQRVVTRLEPRYAQHSIFHRKGMGDLEYQLLRFPSGRHDDLPDALQGLVQLLQYPKGKRKEVKEDTEFEWWRQKSINRHKPRKYIFGKPKKYGIPAQESYR